MQEAIKNEENISTNFEAQKEMLRELIPVYQRAFAGDPWYEVSKCNCLRGFSAQKVGNICDYCDTLLCEEAYPSDALFKNLVQRIKGKPSFVFMERLPNRTAVLGAIAFRSTPQEIYKTKYNGKRKNPAIQRRLEELGEEVIWLDEIFADRTLRASGNLKRLENICIEMYKHLEGQAAIAFRTISPQLVRKAQAIFKDRCIVTNFKDPGVIGGISSLVVIDLRNLNI